MTPLEAAKRMAEHSPTVLDSVTNKLFCGYCGQAIAKREDHAADCPWLATPAIVAVLEAAKRVMDDIGWSWIADHDQPEISAETARALVTVLEAKA